MNCSPCNIPKKNLIASWVNPILGNGSTTLTFTAPNQWNSGCANQLLYSLVCPGGLIEFDVTYFLSGSCPGGQRQACSSQDIDPFRLVLADYTCSPFHLHFTLTSANCPELQSDGYTNFYVDE